MLRIFPKSLLINFGLTTVSYGVVQVLRLVNNVILARLLLPQLFGLMLIVNTLRTGVELLSDVGVSQNIVRSPRGDTPAFYDTAWTLQVLRGLVLGALCFFSSGVAARFFENPQLATILPVVALFFIVTGFDSTGRALLYKRAQIGRLSAIEVILALAGLLIHVVLALITPTIWALILGSLFVSVVTLVSSFLCVPGLRHRFRLDRDVVVEMFQFGRWIFISSIIYFAAMNFDRLYLAREIPLALLGVFGIARSLSDTISSFVNRIGTVILFPLVAQMEGSGNDVRLKLVKGRRVVLLGAALGLAVFTSLSDVIVRVLYDARYAQATEILPVLALGVWFVIIAGINDSILVGIGQPRPVAAANAMKLACYVVGVPIALGQFGFNAAIMVFSAGEFVRYVTLWLLGRRAGIGFVRDDFVATILFVVGVVVFREGLAFVGLTSGMAGLFPTIAALFA